jgi:tRNA 2-thiouridine synthesizing protein B
MTMLHTVNKSPFEHNALDSCLRVARPGASVLLIEDGVYAALRNTEVAHRMSAATTTFSIFVLEPDLIARGRTRDHLIPGVKVVDYGGFVDLVAAHSGVQAWL